MEDVHEIGGTPVILKYLLSKGLLNGNCLTVTGKTIAENLENVKSIICQPGDAVKSLRGDSGTNFVK